MIRKNPKAPAPTSQPTWPIKPIESSHTPDEHYASLESPLALLALEESLDDLKQMTLPDFVTRYRLLRPDCIIQANLDFLTCLFLLNATYTHIPALERCKAKGQPFWMNAAARPHLRAGLTRFLKDVRACIGRDCAVAFNPRHIDYIHSQAERLIAVFLKILPA